MARTSWYKLDNVGKFYSAQAWRSAQTVFRIAVQMSEDVDPRILQLALNDAVEIFPSFNTVLRSGFFWHYLEHVDTPPVVQPENIPICFRLHTGPASTLFRVSYYGRRINIEMSHMISDGRGALELVKLIVGLYVEKRYSIKDALPTYSGIEELEIEDSFVKNREKQKASSTRSPKVYHIPGWKDKTNPTYFEYHLPTSQVHNAAKEIGVGISSLTIAAIIRAISENMTPRDRKRNRPIRMDVPVDLRRFFGSSTLRNFFGLTFVSYTPRAYELPDIAEVAKDIQEQMSSSTQAESLKPRMNQMINIEKNPFIRIAPLFLKDAALKGVNLLSSLEVTTTMSNLGQIEFPAAAAEYIECVSVLTSTKGLNFTICSFGDNMSIGISSAYVRHNVIESFCRIFTKLGIFGYIDINKDNAQIQSDLKQAEIEKRLLGLSNESSKKVRDAK